MKEVEVIIGIIFIVLGAILFSMNWGNIIKLFGFVLLSAGIIIYVLVVDSIDEKKEKNEIKKKDIVLRIFP
jgi:Na+/serine symporter